MYFFEHVLQLKGRINRDRVRSPAPATLLKDGTTSSSGRAVRAIEDETSPAIISTQRARDQDAADEMARVRRDENMQSGLPGRGGEVL